MRPSSLRVVVVVAGLPLVACGARSSPPALPSTRAEPPPSPSRTPVVIAPPTAEPGELRCGLDDGPVPVGDGDHAAEAPLRSFAQADDGSGTVAPERGFLGLRIVRSEQPPPAQLAPERRITRWSLGDRLVASPSFVRRAETCAGGPSANDLGDHRFSLRLADDGRVVSVRLPIAGAPPSQFSACFQSALCEAHGVVASATEATAREAVASVVVEAMPPVFVGQTSFTTVEDSRGMQKRDGSPTGRKVPRRGPFTPAERRWHDDLGPMLRAGTTACAERAPPDRSLGFVVRLPYDPRSRKFLPSDLASTARGAFERILQRCVVEAAAASLRPPPAGLVPNGAVSILVSIDVETNAPATTTNR